MLVLASRNNLIEVNFEDFLDYNETVAFIIIKDDTIQFELGKNRSRQGTHGEKGTGLGMVLVRDLVKLRLAVKPKNNVGPLSRCFRGLKTIGK